MRINTAFILCAGFGKRLNPLTLDTPKPLIKFNNITVLETCINLIENLGIRQIILNTFYLKDQIHNFINDKKFKSKILIIEDGENILDTGGGINNMMKQLGYIKPIPNKPKKPRKQSTPKKSPRN